MVQAIARESKVPVIVESASALIDSAHKKNPEMHAQQGLGKHS